MVTLTNRIFITTELFQKEYEYFYGDKSEAIVLFQYHNRETDTWSSSGKKTYGEALALAHRRAKDGRYKNYDFFIEA